MHLCNYCMVGLQTYRGLIDYSKLFVASLVVCILYVVCLDSYKEYSQ